MELTIPLPWIRFRPASMTENFEESAFVGVGNWGGAVAVGRLADVDEQSAGPERERLQAAQRGVGRALGQHAGRARAHRRADGADVLGRGAAAAAHDVEEAAARE